MKETISQMLKVEAQAQQIVSAAEQEAAEIVRRARAEAAAIEDAAQRRAQAKAAERRDERRAEARGRRARILAEIDQKNEEQRRVAPEKTAAAKAAILAALTGR